MSRRRAVLLGLAATTLAVLALASPAGASNSQTFSDPVGDNEGAGTGAYAYDITSVRVESEDDGLVTFTVTLKGDPAQGGKLWSGDAVGIFIDVDRDQSTGDQGDEVAFRAFGRDNEDPQAQFCRSIEGPLSCQAISLGDFTSVASAQDTQVLTFRLQQGNWFTINFQVITYFNDNNDFAPGPDFTSYFDYDVRADPDGDGFSGISDDCPTRAAGRFDRDHDGCPGPYRTLPRIGVSYRNVSKSSSSIRFSGFAVTGVPNQAGVRVKAGRATFSRRGSGPIRSLFSGQTVTITVSRPGFCTRVRVLKVKPGSPRGWVSVSERSVRPAGIECS